MQTTTTMTATTIILPERVLEKGKNIQRTMKNKTTATTRTKRERDKKTRKKKEK